MKTIEALSSGEFAPPMHAFNHKPTEDDFERLIAVTKESVAFMHGQSADEIDDLAGKTIVFKLGANEMPFTTENFVLSFSLPNFYFHATTAYDILRMKGVKIGKMDFLGKCGSAFKDVISSCRKNLKPQKPHNYDPTGRRFHR